MMRNTTMLKETVDSSWGLVWAEYESQVLHGLYEN
jgi:hypothetical protein